MQLQNFDYDYPEELVAQRPLSKRDDSRMMLVDRRSQKFSHHKVLELPDFLKNGDIVVVNDSKVVPARLFGKRKKEDIELLVVEPATAMDHTWRCLAKKAKRIRTGEKLFFGMQSVATVKGMDGTCLLVEFKNNSLELAMKHHGVPPLPPYIKREGIESYTEEDWERYQTVYANNLGSAAAPTAGLHLSENLLSDIRAKGIKIIPVTLHVGIDTFAPVRCGELTEHKMHGERVSISKDTAEELEKALGEKKRIIAIGTTTARALESWDKMGRGENNFTTNIFIQPGYEFKVVSTLLTNFHQPRSTLLVMVSAFAGREFILKCYEEAIKERYRLFSYGDCMLIG